MSPSKSNRLESIVRPFRWALNDALIQEGSIG